MTRADWLALAERAEMARADGCNALNREIASALGWVARHGQWWPPEAVNLARQRKHSLWRCGAVSRVNVHAYSTSVDAALTTVPEGCHAEISTWSEFPTVRLLRPVPPLFRGELVNASTPALAILAASCRARAEMENDDAE